MFFINMKFCALFSKCQLTQHKQYCIQQNQPCFIRFSIKVNLFIIKLKVKNVIRVCGFFIIFQFQKYI